MHFHTTYSNCHPWGCLDPEWGYQYARDVSFLDVAAAADHLRGIASDPARWPRLQALVRQYYDPGRFVTVPAFESSHAQDFGGDNNVYYRDDDAPHFRLERDDMRGIAPRVHLRELWDQLDANGREYLTIPHHTGRAGKFRMWEEDYHDPQREPLFEIYSSWGSSEMRWSRYPISGGNNEAPSYFVDALKAGARFGVIASSDDHATVPGGVHHFRVEPFRPIQIQGYAHRGLAAVRAPALTRDAVFQALRTRAAYATTHARALVDCTLGDAVMGQEVPADDTLRRERTITVRLTLADAAVARVVLMRNGEPLQMQTVRNPELTTTINEIQFVDSEPLEAVAIRDARYHPDPVAVYYVRVEANQGCTQWTSPIWVEA